MTHRYLYPQAPGGIDGQIAEIAEAPELWQYAPGGTDEQLRVAVDDTLVLDQYAAGGVDQQLIHALPDSGGEYTAGAVHFDGDTLLVNNALVATDNAKVLWSCWFKSTNENGASFFGSDPEEEANNIWSLEGVFTQTAIGVELGEYPFVDAIEVSSDTDGNIADGEWHHVLFAADTSTVLAVYKIYIDDVDRTGAISNENENAFVAAFNGLITYFGGDELEATGLIADVADFQLYLGDSVLVAGDIPEAKRRLFVDADGKPVNPATAIATLGTPTILFSGDADDFATNQGSGGAFAVETGALTNAATSPSAPA